MKKLQMNENTRLAMRSLYRLHEFKNVNATPVLIELEENILKKRLAILTDKEKQFMNDNFNLYQEAEQVSDALAIEQMFQEFTYYLKTLN